MVGDQVAVRFGDFLNQAMGTKQPQLTRYGGGVLSCVDRGGAAEQDTAQVAVAQSVDEELVTADSFKQRCVIGCEWIQGTHTSAWPGRWDAGRRTWNVAKGAGGPEAWLGDVRGGAT